MAATPTDQPPVSMDSATLVDAAPSDTTALVNAIMAPAPGITIDPASVVVISAAGSIAYYNGGLSALGIGAGLLITSGTVPGFTNSMGWFGQDNGMAGDADLDAVINPIFQTNSYDATSLSFNFEVTDPSITGISFNIVFGTDEYPEWVDQFVDIAAIIVNGVNVAFFGNDPNAPLSVISQNLAAGYFIDNGDGHLPIEYDGVSYVLTVFAPVHLGTNSIKIAIADTGDHIYDSGLFISGFQGTHVPVTGVSQDVPCTDGDDTVSGGGGSEVINGKAGNDTLDGGGGDDVMTGGLGNDQLGGGNGKDYLDGGEGQDSLDGGAGDDILQYSAGDLLDGGDGSDTLLLDLSAQTGGVTIDISSPGIAQVLADGASILHVEALQFSGGAGADTVTGGIGADLINGGAGDDVLAGGVGDDTLQGADGYDVARFSGAANDYRVRLVGGGFLVEDLRAGAPDGADLVTDVELFRFSDGDRDPASLVLTGETILGTAGDDVISGVETVGSQGFATALGDIILAGDGDDIVDALGGDDEIDLGAGNDIADAGAGDDRITGGTGSDEITGGDGVDTAVFSGASTDYEIVQKGDGYLITDLRPGSPDGIDQLVSVEYAQFSDGTFKLTVGAVPTVDGGDFGADVFEPLAPEGVTQLSGQVLFRDNNHDDNHTVSVASAAGDQTGVTFTASLAASANGGADGLVDWSVAVDTALIQTLGEGQVRTLTYTVRITDTAGNTVDQDITITITGSNDAPVVTGAVTANASVATGPVTVDPLAMVSDVDMGAKVHMAGAPDTLPAGVTFDPVAQTFTVDPTDPALIAAGGGADQVLTIDYLVTDGFTQAAAQVVFFVAGSNSAPVVAGVALATLGEDAAPATVDLLAQASDPDVGDSLSVADLVVTLASGAWAAPLAFTADTNGINVDPGQFNSLSAGETLSFSIDYAVRDLAGASTPAQAVITVEGANDAPGSLSLSAVHVNEGVGAGGQVGALSAHDQDRNDGLAFSIANDPSGLFAVSGDRLVVATGRTLSAGDVGDHVVRLRVTDTAGGIFERDVTVTVDGLAGVTINGTAKADIIDGLTAPVGQPKVTQAADSIHGGGGNDTINGLGGADTIWGDAGNDTLQGGSGTDTLDGGAGSDNVNGGAGDDILVVRGAEALKDTLVGGNGDEVLGDALKVEGVVAASLVSFDASAQGFERWIGNGQALLGTSAGDRLDLSGLSSISGLPFVDGGLGNDTLIGFGGSDDLRGGAGNDNLDGRGGADVMSGGLGNDVYHVDDQGDVVLELANGGVDTVFASIDFSLAGTNLENAAVEGVAGRTLTGNALVNVLTGGQGADTLFGDAGDDKLFGGAGQDLLDGGDGKDSLDGGLGADTMVGGLGSDTYIIDDAGDVAVENAGAGTDTARVSAGTWTMSDDVDILIFTGEGGFQGVGNALANSMTGGAGDDTLSGLAGADKLAGGLGNDILIGGSGADGLTGGGGSDRFVFQVAADSAMTSIDRIADFSQANGDLIDLGLIDADPAAGGDQGFSFLGTGAFTGHAGEVRYGSLNGLTTVSIDINGDGKADMAIKLTGTVSLAASDFLL